MRPSSSFRPTTSATTCAARRRRCCAIDGLQVLVVDDDSPDGTGSDADALAGGQRRPRLRAASAGPARPWALVHRRACGGAAHRRHAHLSDGRGLLARSRGRCRGCSTPAARRTWSSARATCPAARCSNWPRASRGAQRVRQLVRARDHAAAGARLHQRLPLLAARAARAAAARSHRVRRLRLPGRDGVGGAAPPAAASSKCRSRSSSGARGSRRCRPGHRRIGRSCRGGWSRAAVAGRNE